MSQESVLHKIVQHLSLAPHEKDQLELEISAEWGEPEVPKEGE